jgi:hypothetical protein
MKAIAAILLCVTLTAHADEPGIFGFVFGKPLDLPECPYKTVGGSRMKLYEILVPSTCIQDAHALNGYGKPVREITFSQKEGPLIVKNWRAFPLEANGNLIGFHFLTRGVETQDVVMQQLVEKFGKPVSIERRAIQNSFGAAYSSIEAHWQATPLSVTFFSTRGRIDTGEVFVDLPTAVDLRKTWVESELSTQRKM